MKVRGRRPVAPDEPLGRPLGVCGYLGLVLGQLEIRIAQPRLEVEGRGRGVPGGSRGYCTVSGGGAVPGSPSSGGIVGGIGSGSGGGSGCGGGFGSSCWRVPIDRTYKLAAPVASAAARSCETTFPLRS
jgi:hypothetical protein